MRYKINPPDNENCSIDKRKLSDQMRDFEPGDRNLQQAIIKAFMNLYYYDYYLINNSHIDRYNHVGERTIVFRFAHYLQSILESDSDFNDYVVDCEYNRNLDNEKCISGIKNGVMPDVILHQRNSNDKNLLIMEFKTHWYDDNTYDIDKLKRFTCDSSCYKYQYGMSVIINENYPKITMIRHGNII